MAVGLLWWLTRRRRRRSLDGEPLRSSDAVLPPLDVLIGAAARRCILFGIGIALLVAPLTTALMSSVPVRNAGLASAINNALSRVGQPLLAAAVFIVVSGAFYSALAGGGARDGSRLAELRVDVPGLQPAAEHAPSGARGGGQGRLDGCVPPRGHRGARCCSWPARWSTCSGCDPMRRERRRPRARTPQRTTPPRRRHEGSGPGLTDPLQLGSRCDGRDGPAGRFPARPPEAEAAGERSASSAPSGTRAMPRRP